ncbi:MAG: reactive intermediate/imine deaminase [Chloroflexi bacterium]|nr:reactive intermediate/imine deaminase [Chloroflexota bacterium]
MKRTVRAKNAPQAKGPYSQAVVGAGLIFVSGQLPVDPRTGDFVQGDIAVQTRQTLENIAGILAAEGVGLDDVLKVTVFLRTLSDFSEMNRVYGEFFHQDPPARATVAVADLPLGALLEIEAIALANGAE